MAPCLRSLFVLLLLAPSVLAETGALCTNGLDDDLDGLVDCDDPDCGAAALLGPLDLRVDRSGPGREPALSWSGADPDARIDLAAGPLSTLASSLQGCVFDSVFGGPELIGRWADDPRPDAGSSWYLARAESPCALGSFGVDSRGDERLVDPPCRPGDAPAACLGAPTPGVVSAWVDCDLSDSVFDVVLHLTNDTGSPVQWWSAACPSTPEIDVLVVPGTWWQVPVCIVCIDGDAEWLELAPGEEVAIDPGTWGPCMLPGQTYRARFLVSADCPVSDPHGPDDCPDAQVFTTLPFALAP